jgi:Zn-dependent protease
VRIGLGFWLISLVIGWSGRGGVRGALTWTGIVFLSVLIHELGHAFAARAFGAKPAIFLHGFGGLTVYSTQGLSFTRPRQFLVSAAGPLAGFALGLAALIVWSKVEMTAGQKSVVQMLWFVNFAWGVINLLPVLPLDGGHLLAAVLGPKRAFATAVISGVVATAVVVAGIAYLKAGAIFLVIIFGFAAINAFGQARAAWIADQDRRDGLEEQLKKAKEAIERGDLDDAHLLADDVVRRARAQALKNGGWTAIAWVHVGRGDGRRAREALANLEPKNAIDPHTYAAVEDAAGDPAKARAVLDEARRHGFRTGETAKLHIDLLARAGQLDAAVAIAEEDAGLLGPEALRAVVGAAIDGGAPRAAAGLAAKVFAATSDPSDALSEARAWASAGDLAGALAAIAHAITAGPVDREALRRDPAFETLIGDERFERLLSTV